MMVISAPVAAPAHVAAPEIEIPSQNDHVHQEQARLAQTFTGSLRQLGIRYANEIWAIHITTSHLEQLERDAMVSRAEHAAISEKVKENDKLIQEMKQQVDNLRAIDWAAMKQTSESK
jgi:hypothetical protein